MTFGPAEFDYVYRRKKKMDVMVVYEMMVNTIARTYSGDSSLPLKPLRSPIIGSSIQSQQK